MINVGRYRFDGPVPRKELLRAAPGVYAVLDSRGNDYHVLDVGESRDVKTRVGSHEREGCWIRNKRGGLSYCALYLPGSSQTQRIAIEGELRRQFNPTCGVR